MSLYSPTDLGTALIRLAYAAREIELRDKEIRDLKAHIDSQDRAMRLLSVEKPHETKTSPLRIDRLRGRIFS